jgi:hypothetical protein
LNDNQVRVRFGSKDGLTIFRLDPLTHSISLSHFACSIKEYNDWLFKDASRAQNDHIARTWLLRERATGSIAAYMSLVMDAIKLSFTEKELHNLNYPFKTIPMKIAKLAVDCGFSEKYKGIGSFMLKSAIGKALMCIVSRGRWSNE